MADECCFIWFDIKVLFGDSLNRGLWICIWIVWTEYNESYMEEKVVFCWFEANAKFNYAINISAPVQKVDLVYKTIHKLIQLHSEL